jgi:hypothetical protein
MLDFGIVAITEHPSASISLDGLQADARRLLAEYGPVEIHDQRYGHDGEKRVTIIRWKRRAIAKRAGSPPLVRQVFSLPR